MMYLGCSDESIVVWQTCVAVHARVFLLLGERRGSAELLASFVAQLARRGDTLRERVERRDQLEPVADCTAREVSAIAYSELVSCIALAIDRYCLMKECLSPQEFFGIDVAPESMECRIRRCELKIFEGLECLCDGQLKYEEFMPEAASMVNFCRERELSSLLAPVLTLRPPAMNVVESFGATVVSIADVFLLGKMHAARHSESIPEECEVSTTNKISTAVTVVAVRRLPLSRKGVSPFDSRAKPNKDAKESLEEFSRRVYNKRFCDALQRPPTEPSHLVDTILVKSSQDSSPTRLTKSERPKASGKPAPHERPGDSLNTHPMKLSSTRETSASSIVRNLQLPDLKSATVPPDPWEIVESSKYFRRLLGSQSNRGNPAKKEISRVESIIEELAKCRAF